MLTIGHSYSEKPTQKDDKCHIGTCGICGTDFEEEHYGMESDNTCDACNYENNVVKELKTWTLDFSSTDTDLITQIGTSSVNSQKTFIYEGLTLAFLSCKKGTVSKNGNTTEYKYLYMDKTNASFIANSEAINGIITKIEVVVPAQASYKARYYIELLSVAKLQSVTTGQECKSTEDPKSTQHATLETTFTITADESANARFFNISNTTVANGQIKSITIYYYE